MLTKVILVIISQYIHIQVIMLYTLNLYSVVCQLYLSKTGGKKFKTTMLRFLSQMMEFQVFHKIKSISESKILQ